MLFMESFFKAVFVALSGASLPVTILLFCVWSSIKNGGRIGKYLFLGHFISLIIVTGVLMLSPDAFAGLPLVQFIINILGGVILILVALSLILGLIKNMKLKVPLKVTKQKDVDNEYDDGFNQYEDIYSFSSDQNDYNKEYKTPNRGRFSAFLAGLLFSLTNISWLMWCNFSAAGLIRQTYILHKGSVNGIFGVLLFAAAFLLAEFVLYVLISKLASFAGKFIKPVLFNIITFLVSLGFMLCSIFMFLGAFKISSII